MATQILIRSVDRTANSASSSDFHVELNEAIEGVFVVSNILFPNTIYTFSSGINDKIYWYAGAGNRSATITAGVYTSSSVCSAIKTAMDSVGDGNTYTVAYSSVTRKLTISASNAFYFRFSADTGDGCARQLGFNEATDTASATSTTATNVIDLVGCHSLFLRIDQAVEMLHTTGQSNHANIWLPLQGAFGVYQQSVSSQHYLQKLTFARSKRLRFSIFNSKNQAVSLNGGSMEMLLTKTSELPKSLQFDEEDDEC